MRAIRWFATLAILLLAGSGPLHAGDEAELLAGAATYVPAAANPGVYDVDGKPFVIDSRVTAVQFHVPHVPSGTRRGLARTPTPVLKRANGVDYFQVSGEMSYRGMLYAGVPFVMGPIGPDGVDHRFDAAITHPRSRLTGVHFVLRWPALGWNGALIHHQAAGNGAHEFPPGLLTDVPFDWTALLDRGYALFSMAIGGAAWSRGGLVDTNPDDDTGIFWAGSDLVASLRTARIAADGTEALFPDPTILNFWIADDGGFYYPLNIGNPQIGLDEWSTEDHPPIIQLQHQPEILRDGVVVARNLLRRLTGYRGAIWTAYLGWSGSAGGASGIASGRAAGVLDTPPEVGVPAAGGNFNTWNDPASGCRYDALVLYAGGTPQCSLVGVDHWVEQPNDPKYPVQARTVWIGGDADSLGFSLSGIMWANRIARALPGSALAHTKVDDWIRIYTVRAATHIPHDFLYANALGSDRSGLRYDYDGTFPNPDGFNEQGRGRPVNPTWIEFARWNPGFFDDAESGFFGSYNLPRITPLFLQTLAALRAGAPLPVSRIEPRVFADPGAFDETTPYPMYPVHDCPVLDTYEDVVACAAEVDEDCVLGVTFVEDGEEFSYPAPLEPRFADAVHWFAANNRLRERVEALDTPDTATALGLIAFFFDDAILTRLTDAQLRAGFTAADGRLYRYRSHAEYVSAFGAATDRLVRAGLWDPTLGARYVDEAAQSSVLENR